MDNFDLRKYLAEGKLLKEEVDVLGNEFLQDIQDTMKMYYKMDVDMDDIKDWVKFYYIDYNSEYDEGPGDVDYEGNEFGSEDYESEKKELVFDTAEREDFYMHLNPEADSTFPNLSEGKLLKEMTIQDVYNDAKRQVKDIYNIDVPMDVVKQWADNYQFPYSREEDPEDEDNYILVYDFGTEERGDFMYWLHDEWDEMPLSKTKRMGPPEGQWDFSK